MISLIIHGLRKTENKNYLCNDVGFINDINKTCNDFCFSI